jgi:hypothetical protein
MDGIEFELSTDLSAGILTTAASAVRAVEGQAAHPDSAGKARRRPRAKQGGDEGGAEDLLASEAEDQPAHQFDDMA